MQPFTRMPAELTGASNPPVTNVPSETDKVLPDSFADWLAQPSCTITARPDSQPDPKPGIWVGLTSESQIHIRTDDHLSCG